MPKIKDLADFYGLHRDTVSKYKKDESIFGKRRYNALIYYYKKEKSKTTIDTIRENEILMEVLNQAHRARRYEYDSVDDFTNHGISQELSVSLTVELKALTDEQIKRFWREMPKDWGADAI